MESVAYIDLFSENVRRIAAEFDKATDTQDVDELYSLINRALSNVENENYASQAQIYYSVGTAYSEIKRITKSNDEKLVEKQFFYLRESISAIGKVDMSNPAHRPCIISFVAQLYTNYGNLLSSCGRMISAIDQYLQALVFYPTFGMAQGNLGVAYYKYCILTYPDECKEFFWYFAYHYLTMGVTSRDPNVHDEGRNYFQSVLNAYPPQYKGDEKLVIPAKEYENQEEQAYRKWTLHNHLFLNPLNDLPISESYIAQDTLQLPDMIVKIDDKPIFHGMFNQLKQEFIYARYLTFRSTQGCTDDVHFADKDTFLLNFADYPQYSIRIEELKSAYRILYGLLDKIAFFINSYFDLGIKERDISFNSIWWNSKNGKSGYQYKNVLEPNANYGLNALYWINKDFHERYVDSPNPASKRISDIRNALEHKYVKVTWDLFERQDETGIDDLALYVQEGELAFYTLELLKMLREMIISLAFCVRIEEHKRNQQAETFAVPFAFHLYDDEWKT